MKKSINIIHKIYYQEKNFKMVVTISVNDKCHNGHADFSLTAMADELTKDGRWIDSFGGCCHEEILKRFPDLKLFADLHLSDSNGFPMYAIENGFYHLWDESKTLLQRKKITKKYLRINEKQVNQLLKVKDKLYFRFMIEKLGLPTKWRKEASKAIKKLEELSGQKWDKEYKWEKSNYTSLTKDETLTIKQRLLTGYYTKKAIERREKIKYQNKVYMKKFKIKQHCKEVIAKELLKTKINIWLIDKIETLKATDKTGNFLIDNENIIYHNYTKEICFNWRSYGVQATKENFEKFCNNITEKDFQEVLPSGIIFTLKENDKKVLSFNK